MAVTGIRSVNLFHGINLFPGHAQNADHSWWRRKQKKNHVCNVRIVIIEKVKVTDGRATSGGLFFLTSETIDYG